MESADILRVALSLLLIVALLLVLAWIARRAGWMRAAGSRDTVRVSAMQRLGGRSAVAVVEVEDARLVLGVTAQQITLLHTLPSTRGSAGPPPGAFSETLGQAVARRG